MRFEPPREVVDFVDLLCTRHQSDGYRTVQHTTRRTLAILLNHFGCFSALILTSVCTMSLGLCTPSQLSLFCGRNYRLFDGLLSCAISYVLSLIPSSNISLIVDDTDRPRSKVIKALSYVFKTVCKKTSGFHLAQNIVFVCAVTKYFTFPIAWKFYMPDPAISTWRALKRKFKSQKCCKGKNVKACCLRCKDLLKKIEKCPERDAEKYPSRLEIAVIILARSKKYLCVSSNSSKVLKVMSICADAAYLSPIFLLETAKIFPGTQIISQLKSTQKVCSRTQEPISVKEYFQSKKLHNKTIIIRGTEKNIEYINGKLTVKSHGKKLLIIAMRYESETEYRYLVATDLGWRPEDVIRHYALRWLVEVDIEDWKQNSGFGKGACLQGDEGASCALSLSLLSVFLFLTHPLQLRLLRSGQPLCTAGSLSQRLYADFLMHNVGRIIMSEDPKKAYEQVKVAVEEAFILRSSKKHAGVAFLYPVIENTKPWYKRFNFFSSSS